MNSKDSSSRPKPTHFVGINGIGMSGLAQILLDRGERVSGSDLVIGERGRALSEQGALIHKGHRADQIPKESRVVYSTSIDASNPEVKAALEASHDLLHRSDLLAELMRQTKALAVTGTHGKTSTSALLAHTLIHAGWDPSFAVGGILGGERTNGRFGGGEYFVAEADESDGSFLKYAPFGAIVTGVEEEHLEHFDSKEALFDAFGAFVSRVARSDLLFYWRDDPNLVHWSPNRVGIGYGVSEDCDLQIRECVQEGWQMRFSCRFEGKEYPDVLLNSIGEHQVLNAVAVFGLALRLGVPEEVIREAFRHFPGVKRRMERLEEKRGALFLDDYGHHPTEIEVTLKALRKAIGKRCLRVIFQPHRYSRTKLHLKAFARSFKEVDELYVTPIYAASEQPIQGIDHLGFAKEVEAESQVPVYCHTMEELVPLLREKIRPHDVVLTLGAGDITHLLPRVLKGYSPKRLRVCLLHSGKEVERAASLESAAWAREALDSSLYEIQEIELPKQGPWPTLSALETLLSQECLLPFLHGPYGEDGCIQGLFELLEKPYMGSAVLPSALSMHKGVAKRLALAHGVPTLSFIELSYSKWQEDPEGVVEEILAELGLPLFMKPMELGSSRGVARIATKVDLWSQLKTIWKWGSKVLIEQCCDFKRELEFPVLDGEVFAPGEVLTHGKVYDYEAKCGDARMSSSIEPKLAPHLLLRAKQYAETLMTAFGCKEMARIDFFLDEKGRLYFNEVNPIPGFTTISLYPALLERGGIEAKELVNRLIILALHRHRQRVCL